VFKFVHLSTIVLVPSFLGNIQQYRPLQTGHALAWVAVPMLAVVWLVAWLVIYTNTRLTLTVGLTIVAVASWLCAHLDSSWSGTSFIVLELILAAGFACTYIGLVSSIVLEAIEAGVLTSPANAATYSGFMHFIRIFGGQIGVTAMTWFLSDRQKFHSNMLGLYVQSGSWLTDERIRMLTGGLLPSSTGPEEALARAVKILDQQVRAQAYTLASADAFILIAWMVVAYLVLMLLMRPAKISFKDIRRMP
jgi:DHA2 family multidrug resistance protein